MLEKEVREKNKLTIADVMEICGCKRQKVYNWIKLGYLKPERDQIGVGGSDGRYVIDEDDLRSFIMSDNYEGHPEDILHHRAFTRVPILEDCYPVNLLIACLEIPIDTDEVTTDIWDYDIRHFRKLISTLMDKEQRVLEMRYQFGMSLDEVGKALNLTRERIRQIQKKAERKLRYRTASGGIWVVNREKYDALKQENNELKARLSNLEHNLDVCKARLEEPSSAEVEHSEEEPDPKIEDFNKVKLEELDWSVRAYNCLKRAGFNTLGDIFYFDQNQGNIEEPFRTQNWRSIRNLGKKTLIEIARVIFEYCSYRLQDWYNEQYGYIGLIPLAPNEEFCSVPIYRGE